MADAAASRGALTGGDAQQPAAGHGPPSFTPERLLALCGEPRLTGAPPRHQWIPDLLDAQEALLYPLVRASVEFQYPAADEEELLYLACVLCKAYAPATVSAYVSKLRDFAAFCQDRGFPGLPCTKQHVHLWLLHLGIRGTVASAGFAQCVSAINSIHNLLGMPAPVPAGDPLHAMLLQGFGRTLLPTVAPAVKRPLPVEWLEAAVEAALADGASVEFVRDVAMCCVGFACGLRGSSLAALSVGDVALEPPDEPRLLRVNARVHKTRNALAPQVSDWEFYLHDHPRLGLLLHTFSLLRRMKAPGGDAAPLWWWQDLGGSAAALTEAAVDAAVRRVVARAAPAGVEAVSFSSHSLRVGLASALNALGVPRDNIRLWIRWASPSMLDVYIRPVPAHAAMAKWFGWMVARPPALRRE